MRHNQAVAEEVVKAMKPSDAKMILKAAENKMVEPEETKEVDEPLPPVEATPKPGCPECGGPKQGLGFRHADECSKKKKKKGK
jgi:hypothetical protein